MTLTPERQVKSSGSGRTKFETDAVDATSRSSPATNGSAAEGSSTGSSAESTASIKPPSKFERLKAASDYLKEPLATELENDKPFFTDGAVQILKVHGSYQQDNRDNRQKGQEKDWQMMLRLRSPAGRIPVPLYLAMDDLADRLGNGTLRLTTRQAFQMHGIAKADIREVIGTIVRSM